MTALPKGTEVKGPTTSSIDREQTLICPKCGDIKPPGKEFYTPSNTELLQAVNGLAGWLNCPECRT